MPKKIRRQQMKQKRLSMDSSEKLTLSKKICENIQKTSIYKHAKKIGLYLSINNEVDLKELLFDKEKKFYLPTIQSDWKLNFYHYALGDPLIQNHQISEPALKENSIDLNHLDLVLVPLLAFDQKGYRIGSGKGCYDKTFRNILGCPILMGVGYSFQEIKQVEYEPHDIRMDYIVTELDCYHCS